MRSDPQPGTWVLFGVYADGAVLVTVAEWTGDDLIESATHAFEDWRHALEVLSGPLNPLLTARGWLITGLWREGEDLSFYLNVGGGGGEGK
jgi:hypothetical protein